MTRRQCSAVDRALRLIARGMALRHAAIVCGVSPSTIVRARKRAGLGPMRERKL